MSLIAREVAVIAIHAYTMNFEKIQIPEHR